MGNKNTCSTCSWYKKPASDWGVKYQAGGCGNMKLGIGYSIENITGPLADQLVIYGGTVGSLIVGSGFGCIHHKTSGGSK